MKRDSNLNVFFSSSSSPLQRPPSSSLSYGGAMNDDVRSPGSGSTPGPLSAQPPPGLGDPDPGKSPHNHYASVHQSIELSESRPHVVFGSLHICTLQLVIFARYHRSPADFELKSND
jgi:hypothetical protein